MNCEQKLYYKTRQEIDVDKWNNCVREAENGSIYACCVYLDSMADQWDALVLNDYEAIMPLPWRKKFGIHYLYQPFLAPQLGVIAKKLTKELMEYFLKSIPQKFSFWEINLNTGNVFPIAEFPIVSHENYFIPLSQPYEDITKNYNQNLKRNIKKALSSGCLYKDNIPVQEVLHAATKQLSEFMNFSSTDIARFTCVTESLQQQKKAETIGVYQNGVLCAASVFLFDDDTAYYILATTTLTGKKIGASHFLLDEFIKRHTGKIAKLDFAGTDVPSVAQFYRAFGAKVRLYSSIRLNKLHPLIRWMKG